MPKVYLVNLLVPMRSKKGVGARLESLHYTPISYLSEDSQKELGHCLLKALEARGVAFAGIYYHFCQTAIIPPARTSSELEGVLARTSRNTYPKGSPLWMCWSPHPSAHTPLAGTELLFRLSDRYLDVYAHPPTLSPLPSTHQGKSVSTKAQSESLTQMGLNL